MFDLFNRTVSSSDCVVSNDGMVNKCLIRMDVIRISHGVLQYAISSSASMI
jgi:hypothetical protein